MSKTDSPMAVKYRNNLELFELVCQLHARALQHSTLENHKPYLEAREELEKRLSPKEDQQPSKSREEILDGWDKRVFLSDSAKSECLRMMEEYRNQPKDQQPSGDVEKAALDFFRNTRGINFEEGWMEIFKAGAKWANTQPIKEDTPAGDWTEFIKNRIEQLKETDKHFCDIRWDVKKGNTERLLAREQSNEVTAVRHELEALLNHFKNKVKEDTPIDDKQQS